MFDLQHDPLNPFGKCTSGTPPLPYTLTAQPVDQSRKTNYSTSDFIQPQIHHHNHSFTFNPNPPFSSSRAKLQHPPKCRLPNPPPSKPKNPRCPRRTTASTSKTTLPCIMPATRLSGNNGCAAWCPGSSGRNWASAIREKEWIIWRSVDFWGVSGLFPAVILHLPLGGFAWLDWFEGDSLVRHKDTDRLLTSVTACNRKILRSHSWTQDPGLPRPGEELLLLREQVGLKRLRILLPCLFMFSMVLACFFCTLSNAWVRFRVRSLLLPIYLLVYNLPYYEQLKEWDTVMDAAAFLSCLQGSMWKTRALDERRIELWGFEKDGWTEECTCTYIIYYEFEVLSCQVYPVTLFSCMAPQYQ